MNELERQVESYFSPAKWVNVRTLVAVSGGPDSVAVLRAMAAIGRSSNHWESGNLIVAHVNHATRGSESDTDARFVRELAGELGLKFHQSDASAAHDVGSSEESFRDFRYGQLIELAQTLGARYIVTGHNLDDQVETILFRIFRGTGISGLAGIPKQRMASESVTIIRPLLGISRSEIEDYLRQIGQAFRSDSSNADSKYTRNFLRNELLPKLKERFGETVSDSVSRLGKQAQEVDLYLLAQSARLDDAIGQRTNKKIGIDCSKLQPCDPLIIRHWLTQLWIEQDWPRQAMTFQWWQTITESLKSGSDTVLNLPCSIRFEKAGPIASFTDLR